MPCCCALLLISACSSKKCAQSQKMHSGQNSKRKSSFLLQTFRFENLVRTLCLANVIQNTRVTYSSAHGSASNISEKCSLLRTVNIMWTVIFIDVVVVIVVWGKIITEVRIYIFSLH
jgi:hypothetical protein